MKTAPCLVAGFTACAALGAGVMLAAEDRALFEPQHAAGLIDPAGWAGTPVVRRPAAQPVELRRGMSSRSAASVGRDRP